MWMNDRNKFVVVLITLLVGWATLSPTYAFEASPNRITQTRESTMCLDIEERGISEIENVPITYQLRIDVASQLYYCPIDWSHVSFDVITEEGTAKADTDYLPVHLTHVYLARNQFPYSVPVTILADAEVETDEIFTLHLINVVLYDAEGTAYDHLSYSGRFYILDFRLLPIMIFPEPIGSPMPAALTSEDGTSATFEIWLGFVPTADVTLTLDYHYFTMPNNGPTHVVATVSPTQLIFTPQNYQTRQTITITGRDDAGLPLNETYTYYRILVAATSNDTTFNGVAAVIFGLNLDNDTTITPNIITPPPVESLPSLVPERILYLSSDVPTLIYDAPNGEPIVINSEILILPHDADGSGSDSYIIVDAEMIAGELWVGVFLGGPQLGWIVYP